MDRFFRGIGNRFRGVREEEVVDGGDSTRAAEEPASSDDKTQLSAAAEPEAASDQADAGTVDEAADPSSDTEDDAITDDDTGSDDAPASDGDDDGTTVTLTDGDGSIASGGDGTTIVITDGDESLVWGDGSSYDGTTITITDGNDGSIIIENPVDTESGSDDSVEPPHEPEREPHPEPEPEPEPQPDSDDVVSVGGGRDVEEVIVIDGATPVEAERPEAVRPGTESGAESSESISAAEAVRAGLIAPEDLRVQSNIEFRGNLAGLITSDDDDDDDDAMLAPRDEFIEIPRFENQPAPGSGPPNPQPVGEARLVGDADFGSGDSFNPDATAATNEPLPIEVDEEDDEPEQPVYEPLPQYTIGDPISSGGQPAGISSADLRVSTSPDIGQYIDTDLIQERLAQNGEDDVLAPDEIERPTIKLERAPGEGPPQVGSLDVMDTAARSTVVTDGDTRSDTEEEEDLGFLQRPDIGLERVPLLEARQVETSNIFDTNPEDGSTRHVSSLDVEDTKPMAGDSEAGEPSRTLEPMQSAEIAQSTPLEFVEAPEIVRVDAPIDFQTTPVIEQQPKVAEVETAVPAAINPQPAISPVQPNLPVELQSLANNENLYEVEFKTLTDTPADDDDDDPLNGM